MDRVSNDPFLSDKSHFDAPRLTVVPVGGGALFHNSFGYDNLQGNPFFPA